MIIFAYSETNRGTLSARLGKPEYSYHFVREKFLPVLRRIGEVVEVEDIEAQLPELQRRSEQDARNSVFLFFGPPHRAPRGLGLRTVCVFAWEYATIPAETWDDNPGNDWRVPLLEFGHAITLSSYAARAVRLAIPDGLDLAVIPAPIAAPAGWRARARSLWGRTALKHGAPLEIAGRIYDSRAYRISHEFVEPIESSSNPQRANWRGEPLDWTFDSEAGASTLALVGFYNADLWGSWSRNRNPWITLPWRVATSCRVSLHLLGIGPNVERDIEVEMGGDRRRIRLRAELETYTLDFEPGFAADAIRFYGIVPTPGGVSAADPRTLGMGIASLRIHAAEGAFEAPPDPDELPREQEPRVESLSLDGVVYTSVFNPEDGRKNWEDMVTAFCWSMRDREDATLVLKMSHHNPATFYGRLMALWSALHPFRCRIIALHGFLDDRQYRMLVDATSYIVNSSRCEGQCLPLMEFMRCGVPAIAPAHTAMSDYIDARNAFIVDAAPAIDCWPQDPRRAYRTRSYRIDWDSLRNAFDVAHRCATGSALRYRLMGGHAARRIAGRFSARSVRRKLRRFLLGIMRDE